MSDAVTFPAVPTDRLESGGWVERDRQVETVFRLPTARVRGATLVFDDERSREALREATGLDRQVRFFFATRLHFEPPLPSGVGAAMILPSVRSASRDNFAAALRDRGLVDVSRERTERVRVNSGDRARLTRYGARLPLEGGAETPVTGWVGAWHGDGFRVAGGAYPTRPLAETLELADPPAALARDGAAYREELLDLLRSVS
ncbi:MAG: hypothetical protein ABEJ89_02575 [Haloarculaceae archaeon]